MSKTKNLSLTLKAFALALSVVALAWSGVYTFYLVSGFLYDIQLMLFVVWALFAIIFLILFSIWIVRITKNARVIGGKEAAPLPFWAVLAYFIPVINLFVPFLHMKRIWQVTKEKKSEWKVFQFWWIFFAVGEGVGNFSDLYYLQFPENELVQDVSIILVVVFLSISNFFLLKVITIIDRNQRKRIKKDNISSFSKEKSALAV